MYAGGQLGELLADDVVWHVPGTRPIAGDYRGPDAVLGYFRVRRELAVRDWSRRDRTVAKRLKRIDNRRMEYMRALFRDFCRDDDEVEVRCMLVMSLFIANHLTAAGHGAHSRAEVRELALKRLLA